jgi:hypothetical protein
MEKANDKSKMNGNEAGQDKKESNKKCKCCFCAFLAVFIFFAVLIVVALAILCHVIFTAPDESYTYAFVTITTICISAMVCCMVIFIVAIITKLKFKEAAIKSKQDSATTAILRDVYQKIFTDSNNKVN